MRPLIVLTAFAATSATARPTRWRTSGTSMMSGMPMMKPCAHGHGMMHCSSHHNNSMANEQHGAGPHRHRPPHSSDHDVYDYRYSLQRGAAGPAQHGRLGHHRHAARSVDAVDLTDLTDLTGLTEPPPCKPMSPPPDEAATKARFDTFAHAFLVTKNITEAFTFISKGYINHNPLAQNGAAAAWNILSPIWASQSITVLRTTFKDDMGWLNYRAGGLGEVVDRYRWEAGCIVEHWDQGEKYPSS